MINQDNNEATFLARKIEARQMVVDFLAPIMGVVCAYAIDSAASEIADGLYSSPMDALEAQGYRF